MKGSHFVTSLQLYYILLFAPKRPFWDKSLNFSYNLTLFARFWAIFRNFVAN